MKMKTSKPIKSFQVAALPLAISLSLVSFAPPGLAASTKLTNKSVANSLVTQKQQGLQQQIVKEAADAFKATETALKALNNDQPKQALAALQVASGNLHLLLTRDPTLNMVPIDIKVQVIEGIHDLKRIKVLEVNLEDLVDEGRIQDARPIIDSLVDELRVTTVYLPLATYPAAIDQVAPLIDAGKIDEAKQLLVDTLETYVIEETVTPLTIIKAEEQLSEAFQIEHTSNLKQQETKNKIAKLINQAEQNIKIAEALGYGSKKDYGELYDGIDALKQAIGTGGFKGEWLKLKKSMSSLKNKIVHPAG